MERLLVTSLSRMTQAPCKHQVHGVFANQFLIVEAHVLQADHPTQGKQKRYAKLFAQICVISSPKFCQCISAS
jgi:hypothetical protein